MDSRRMWSKRAAAKFMALAGALASALQVHADPALPDLTPDASFGGTGSVSFQVMGDAGALRIAGIGHAVREDGSILVATAHTAAATATLALRVLKRDGSLDTSFGTNGVRIHSLPACGAAGTPIVLQAAPNGRHIVALGPCTIGLLADGSLDANYANAGVYVDTKNFFPQFMRADKQGRALHFRRNSMVYAFEAARLTVDGAVDTSFGTGATGNGQLVTGSGSWYMWDSMLQPDGKPVVLAQSNVFNGVGRWTAEGKPDSTLAGNGLGTIQCLPGSKFCGPAGGIARSDGTIALAITDMFNDVERVGAQIIDAQAQPIAPIQTFALSAFPILGADAGNSDIRMAALAGDRSAMVFSATAIGSTTTDIIVICLRGDATLDPRCGSEGYTLLDTVVPGPARGNDYPRWVTYNSGELLIAAITTVSAQQYATIWRLGMDRIFDNGLELARR